jgi:hypothetical protein
MHIPVVLFSVDGRAYAERQQAQHEQSLLRAHVQRIERSTIKRLLGAKEDACYLEGDTAAEAREHCAKHRCAH